MLQTDQGNLEARSVMLVGGALGGISDMPHTRNKPYAAPNIMVTDSSVSGPILCCYSFKGTKAHSLDLAKENPSFSRKNRKLFNKT